MLCLDLNCDLGEGAAEDGALMPLISSANIACGAHAGDSATMRRTAALALRHGVALGAHPGFADRAHFGRRELPLSGDEARELVLRQVLGLREIAADLGAALAHVKPHGALYNLAARDRSVADGVAQAVAQAGPGLILVGLAGSRLLEAGRAAGLRVAGEIFADRTYQPDGLLTPRSRGDALIADEAAAAAQVLRAAREGCVVATDGSRVPVAADTVCLHGDGARALAFARLLRQALAEAGVAVRAL